MSKSCEGHQCENQHKGLQRSVHITIIYQKVLTYRTQPLVSESGGGSGLELQKNMAKILPGTTPMLTGCTHKYMTIQLRDF